MRGGMCVSSKQLVQAFDIAEVAVSLKKQIDKVVAGLLKREGLG